MSALPGMKEGISGSILSGTNIGIIKNISEDRKEAALEVLKYFTSKEYQKEKFKERVLSTSIDEILNDEEVCKKNGLCELAKSIQYTVEPEFIKEKSEDYRKRYQKYIYQYLHEDKTIEETLKKINDITAIYYMTLDTENSYIGLVYFIFIFVLSLLMLLSLTFIVRESFRPFIMFLTDDFWVITVLGSILILWTPVIGYGPVMALKCHMKLLLISIGYTLSICPAMYKLIIQFPEKSKLIEWIYKHKYLFLLFNILMDILINSISLISVCTSQTVLVEDGESFEKCKYNGEYSFILLIVYKCMVIVLILLLIFVEWNNSSSWYDVRFITVALYIDILSIILIYTFHVIQIKNYISFFMIPAANTTIISFSNYICLYGFRVIIGLMRKRDITLDFISRIEESFITTQSQLKSFNDSSKNNKKNSIYKSELMDHNENNINFETASTKRTSFIARMINYHYSNQEYNSSSTSSASNTFNK